METTGIILKYVTCLPLIEDRQVVAGNISTFPNSYLQIPLFNAHFMPSQSP